MKISSIGWILPVFDLNAEHRKLCQTFFSFKHPLFFFIILFYFPFLFVWCWKSLWAFPPQWRELWSAGEAQLSSPSLIFPLLTLSAEEWGGHEEHELSGFSLFKPSLSQICFFSSVCICMFSRGKIIFFCSTTCLFVKPYQWNGVSCHDLNYKLCNFLLSGYSFYPRSTAAQMI